MGHRCNHGDGDCRGKQRVLDEILTVGLPKQAFRSSRYVHDSQGRVRFNPMYRLFRGLSLARCAPVQVSRWSLTPKRRFVNGVPAGKQRGRNCRQMSGLDTGGVRDVTPDGDDESHGVSSWGISPPPGVASAEQACATDIPTRSGVSRRYFARQQRLCRVSQSRAVLQADNGAVRGACRSRLCEGFRCV